jgi:phosphoribosylformimino-5-aminoimidazole carboxamide ribotide isomerase
MQIVGVIDLKAGRAVRARGGVRHEYLPVSRAGDRDVQGDALRLVRFYRETVGLSEIYVADLDAIAGLAPQRDLFRAISASGPTWLDAGASAVVSAHAAIDAGASRVIVGLETLPDFGALEQIATALPTGRLVFSLDLLDGRLLCRRGSPIARESLESVAAQAWRLGVRTIVVLDLRRVGGDTGPAFHAVRRVRESVPEA